MKRRKGRIILGTTAVAAALTLGGCAGGGNTAPQTGSTAAVTSDTAAEAKTEDAPDAAQTADTAQGAKTAETASDTQTAEKHESEENEGETIRDFEVFDPADNYNNIVYGPPKDN